MRIFFSSSKYSIRRASNSKQGGLVQGRHSRLAVERRLQRERRENAAVAARIGIPWYDSRDGTL